MKKLIVMTTLLLTIMSTQAEILVQWGGASNLGGSSDYATDGNWSSSGGYRGYPTSSDNMGSIISYGDADILSSMPIISTPIGDAPLLFRIAGADFGGMLTILAGGSITANALEIGTDGTGTGVLNVDGGLLSVTNGLKMGTAGPATINHTGGTIHLNTLLIGGTGAVNLSPGAMFIVDGDQTSASWLTSFTSTVGGAIDTDFDGTQTSITTIPEPATIGLVATFGGALLFIRRKYKR